MSSTPAREKTAKCKDCGKRKSVDKFEKDRRLPGGRTKRCRDCATDAQQGWRKEQPKTWKASERKRIREAVRALRAKRAKVAKKKTRKGR